MAKELQIERDLDDARRSVPVSQGRWWRRLLAFVGPAYLVSVGYMDPGNWATDLAGGAKFGYQLIWVLLMANLMAVLLQTLSARLGLVTGRDLAQACRDEYPRSIRYALFVLCEIAIIATDLAEVLGSAVGISLLTWGRVPVLWGVLITGFDVLLLLVIQRWGVRKMEALIVMLIATIGLCFVVELFLCRPAAGGIVAGFVPQALSGESLYIAIGILGATVMPHNLYLHSSLAQSRDVARSRLGVEQACRYNFIDSAIAMNGAFLVNAAILIVAAATFWSRGIEVTELQQAHGLLKELLGTTAAPVAFALALICAGQSSTLTGTLAGQITMEGFLNIRVRPWLRRLATRLLAIVPAVAVILAMGEKGVYPLMILSQVVLSLQLPFAVVPLVRFTSSRQRMGSFASAAWVRVLAWVVTAVIIGLNGKLAYEQIADWCGAAGTYGWLVAAGILPAAGALCVLLLWLVLRRERPAEQPRLVTAEEVIAGSRRVGKQFRRIGVALEAKATDASMLAEAVALARSHGAELVLLHVVEGVGGQWYGPQTGDYESRHDQEYLDALAGRLKTELAADGVGDVRGVLGFGDVPRELVRLARREDLDLLVVGGHGHRGLNDILRGTTITAVRHALKIPLFAVRRSALDGQIRNPKFEIRNKIQNSHKEHGRLEQIMSPKNRPPREARAEARKRPDGHVYKIEGDFGPNDAVPPEAIVGAWKVDSAGKIVGEFIPNPNYRPQKRR